MNHTKISMHGDHNDSIGCSVSECKYHSRDNNYCTLQQINVVKNGPMANDVQGTDCGSFERR